MVTVIGSGTSIRRTVLYNENKVEEGVARCIMAANYPIDLERTNKEMRLNMLLRTASLHPNVKRSSIHITLNFAVGEVLSDDKLKEIATEYMTQIGFGEQPFLIYRHDDAAHPHIHIATVKIRPDGTRIDTQNIGRNKSEPARKALENKYGLVRAEEQKNQILSLLPVNSAKVIYGEVPTRKAIATVLKNILPRYKYTSLHELNAVLNQYNIAADGGSDQSRIYKHHGMVYRVIDAGGKPIGVTIKASAINNKPGLKYLEERYLINSVERQPHKLRIKNKIDLALLRNPKITIEQLAAILKKEAIHMAIRQNPEGFIYGLTYVDHSTQCVFNGSTLGKQYSAKGLLERLQQDPANVLPNTQKQEIQRGLKGKNIDVSTLEHQLPNAENDAEKGIIEQIIQPEYSPDSMPFEWKRKKRKKKKR